MLSSGIVISFPCSEPIVNASTSSGIDNLLTTKSPFFMTSFGITYEKVN